LQLVFFAGRLPGRQALFFVWRPARWANWMFEVDEYDVTTGNFSFGKGGNQVRAACHGALLFMLVQSADRASRLRGQNMPKYGASLCFARPCA